MESLAGTGLLSEQATWLWAKSDQSRERDPDRWLPLHQHLSDTGAVAAHLWDTWLPAAAKRAVADSVGGESARAAATFLPAVHDIGKATPTFACARSAEHLGDLAAVHGLPFDIERSRKLRPQWPHSRTGARLLAEALIVAGGTVRRANTLAAVVAAHHGDIISSVELTQSWPANEHERRAVYGTEPWTKSQHELLTAAAAVAGTELANVATWQLTHQAARVLTALVVMSDWVASDPWLFPLLRSRTQQFDPRAHSRLAAAMSKIDLPAPWAAASPPADPDQAVRDRFGFPAARPVQAATLAAARLVNGPGVVIVEAPMGGGKSEAAQLAAEHLASAVGAHGIFYALPTQVTSNAMSRRVARWLERTPDGESSAAESQFVALSHGKASLSSDYRALPRAGAHTPATGGTRVHRWLDDKPRLSRLAPFVVGTVDQVLMLALESKHNTLRHLSLIGKVVIIDEVHSYDARMLSFLDSALRWLGAYGVPVIMLSATLPAATRQDLLLAYADGRRQVTSQPAPIVPERVSYPAATALTDGGQVVEVPFAAEELRRTLTITRVDADEPLADILGPRLSGGGCAAVVCNTVSRARQAYAQAVEVFGESNVTLLHSRFSLVDRERIELRLLDMLGPGSTTRPELHVVVATQVIEASLDIDFDTMVSDLAPVDSVLQRAGRLHRHPGRDRPAALSAPELVLRGAFGDEHEPPRHARAHTAIYAGLAMDRAAVAFGSVAHVRLPDDIDPLVQAAYPRDRAAALAGAPAAWAERLASRFADDVKKRANGSATTESVRIVAPDPRRLMLASAPDCDPDEDDAVRTVRSVLPSTTLLLLDATGGEDALPPWSDGEFAGRVIDLTQTPRRYEPGDAALMAAVARACVTAPNVSVEGGSFASLSSLPDTEEVEVVRTRAATARDGHSRERHPWASVPGMGDAVVVRLTQRTADGGLRGRAGGIAFSYSPRLGLWAATQAR